MKYNYFIIILFTALITKSSITQENNYPVYHAGFNLIPGRVIVKANNIIINEYYDWVADYKNNLIKIIDLELISVGAEINILEKNSQGIYEIPDTLRYIDIGDFYRYWELAGIPHGQPDIFPEAILTDDQKILHNRAKIAWYKIDPIINNFRSTLRPPNISKQEISKQEVRLVLECEIFPRKDFPHGIPTFLHTFDLAYYPNLRGPYNFNVLQDEYSAGINSSGQLNQPETRWSGIMRNIEYSNLEGLGVKYIDILLLDPYHMSFPIDTSSCSPKLLIQIGKFSEDVNKDGYQFYENAVVPNSGHNSSFGLIPYNTPSNNYFIDENYQDLGLDGISDTQEKEKFANYLYNLKNEFGEESTAYILALNDPSADNYHYFRGSDFDADPDYSSILERYKNFNNSDGNSGINVTEAYPTAYTTFPDNEDINSNFDFDTTEQYYQYEINLSQTACDTSNIYIVDDYFAQGIPLPNGEITCARWLRIKIPVEYPDTIIGNLQDLSDIKMIRLILTGYKSKTVLRFAWFVLSRAEDPFPFFNININNPYQFYDSLFKETYKPLIYPNPNNGRCKLNIPLSDAKTIEIYDINGNLVYNKEFTPENTSSFDNRDYKKFVYLPNLKKGIYIFKIFQESGNILTGKMNVFD